MAELVAEAQQTSAAQPQETASQRSTAEQLQESLSLASSRQGTAGQLHYIGARRGMAEQPSVQHLPPRPLEPTPSGDLRLPERNEAQRVTADASERDGVCCLLLTGFLNGVTTSSGQRPPAAVPPAAVPHSVPLQQGLLTTLVSFLAVRLAVAAS